MKELKIEQADTAGWRVWFLVHCSAGVDRTGCAVDLLKTILLAANSLRVSRVGKLIHLTQDNPNGCFRLWG